MNFMITKAEVESPLTDKVIDKERIHAEKKAMAEAKKKEQEAKKQAKALEKQQKREQKLLEKQQKPVKEPKAIKPKTKKTQVAKDSTDMSESEWETNFFGMKKKKPRAEYRAEIDKLELQLSAKDQALSQKEQALAQQTRELNLLKNWARNCPVH